MVNNANKGKSLETLVEYANKQYEVKGLWAGLKVPTPVTVKRSGHEIAGAFYSEKSTVDFIGLSQGSPVAFDVKQTTNKTSFPLKNIKDHQLTFLKNWQQNKGASFLLVEFVAHRKIYFLKLDTLLSFLASHDRKSIPLTFFEENCQVIKEGKGIVLDYLSYIHQNNLKSEGN